MSRTLKETIERDDSTRLVIVRVIHSKELVGFFRAASDAHLMDMIDECTDPEACEFREISNFGLYWPGDDAPTVPSTRVTSDDTDLGDDILAKAVLADTAYMELENDGEWFRLTDGHVYLLKAGDRYKIGFAIDVAQRLKQLQTGSPYPIELIGWYYADMAEERELHRTYAAYRRHGEWFELPEEAVAYFKKRSFGAVDSGDDTG